MGKKLTTIQMLEGIATQKEARRDALVAELALIDRSLGTLRLSIQEVEEADIPSQPQEGTIQQVLTDFLFGVLSDEGPMHRKELLQRAQQHGIHIGGKDVTNQMSSYMSKDSRFSSDGRGHWNVSDHGRESQIARANVDYLPICG